MRRLLLPIGSAFLLFATLAGAAAPDLPIRRIIRQVVEPFPGGGVVPAYRLRAGQPGTEIRDADLAFDTATEVGPGIRRILQEVGSDPQTAYLWVRNQVEYEPYHGVKRGAEGAAWEKAGNDFDQAALLAALLRSQGVPSRFVYGVVRVKGADLADWCGVAAEEEAYRLVVQGGVPALAIRAGGRVQFVELHHLWLEAHLPYTNPGYRGPGEKVWVPLDPSYKTHEIELGEDLYPRLGFQEEEFLFDYLASPKDESPEQAFRDLLRDKLVALGLGGSLSQAAYTARIVAEPAGALPLALPPPLQVLGTIWEKPQVPEVYHYRFRLTLWDGVDDRSGVTPGDVRFTVPTAFLASHTLNLVYVPASPADQGLVDGSPTRSPRDPTIRDRIELKPVFTIDGLPLGEVLPGDFTEANPPPHPFQTGNAGVVQKVLVETLFPGHQPGESGQPVDHSTPQFGTVPFEVKVGAAYAFGADAMATTAEQLVHRAARLRARQQTGTAEDVLGATVSLAAQEYLHRVGLSAAMFSRLLGIRHLKEPSPRPVRHRRTGGRLLRRHRLHGRRGLPGRPGRPGAGIYVPLGRRDVLPGAQGARGHV